MKMGAVGGPGLRHRASGPAVARAPLCGGSTWRVQEQKRARDSLAGPAPRSIARVVASACGRRHQGQLQATRMGRSGLVSQADVLSSRPGRVRLWGAVLAPAARAGVPLRAGRVGGACSPRSGQRHEACRPVFVAPAGHPAAACLTAVPVCCCSPHTQAAHKPSCLVLSAGAGSWSSR
jgi:hypothetical protein